ncbi:hypothetical protein BKK39_17075 [Bacillus cereus]|nr:hypothetical protein BKK39_17075 [Bacillus cereus]
MFLELMLSWAFTSGTICYNANANCGTSKKHKRNTAIKNILPLYTPLLRGYTALLRKKKGIQQA